MARTIPALLVFFSGFTGLVYQVLWMRQLGLLFGNTAHAAAATLAVFFGGLAAGSWFWGKRVSETTALANVGVVKGTTLGAAHVAKPLRTYAWLEVGIATAAALYFALMPLFRLVYPPLYQSAGGGPLLFPVRCLLAAFLVFPPAFFMGGTVPAMGQFLVRRRERFGTVTAGIYGTNTLGAATGALAAAFLGVPLLGFTTTCFVAMATSVILAVVAFRLSKGEAGGYTTGKIEAGTSGKLPVGTKPKRSRKKAGKGEESAPGLGRPILFSFAFLSGFSVLALEVLWTRMFAQVHENSVYSFAAVVVIVLVCLSLGALLASGLARLAISPRRCLAWLLLAAGVLLGLSPMVFLGATGNLTMVSTDGSFAHYVGTIFALGFVTIGLPCLALGVIFPYLMKGEERFADRPGRSIGSLFAVNTVGSILGALLCGLVLLPFLGMWWTVIVFAAVYLAAGTVLPSASGAGALLPRVVGAGLLVLLFTALNPSGLPVVGANPKRAAQTVLEVWEASGCSVSVVEMEAGHLAIKINSNYMLGSTDAIPSQVFQGRIPMFAFPDTRSVFFLGLGTGISAGAVLNEALFPELERVVACELVPEVVTAAKRYMAGGEGGPDYTGGLFEDPRVEILIEDGRHYLMATDATFDMINADLFLPYRSGAGSLYSREHFECVRERLNPEGVFVQWLPLFQLTDFEFGTICRTMLEVFEQVTLWRNTLQPGNEIVALVGQNRQTPLPSCDRDATEKKLRAVLGQDWHRLPQLSLPLDEQTVTVFYAGNVTAAKELFEEYPVNTDDKPVIEYASPRSMHKQTREDRMPPTLGGPRLVELVEKLYEILPPDTDPMLANRTPGNRRLPVAGAALHRAWVGYAMGNLKACRQAWQRFVQEWANLDGAPRRM